MDEEHAFNPHAEQERELRRQVRARWGSVTVRGFTRKADGTLLFVQLQDPHVPRSVDVRARSVFWDPRTDLILGDSGSVEVFKWFEQQVAAGLTEK